MKNDALLDLILKSVLETVDYWKTDSFFKNKINLRIDGFSINNFNFNRKDYQSITFIVIGKGLIALIELLNRLLPIYNAVKLFALIPENLLIEFEINNNFTKVLYGNHPVPKEKSFKSTLEIINFLELQKKDDLVIFFIGGGTSSLFSYPNDDLSEEQFTEIWEEILFSGLAIDKINILRGIIDKVKKGGVNSFCNAFIFGFYISDVVGDKIDTIGSGPTIIGSNNNEDSQNILEKLKLPRELYQKIHNMILEKKITNREQTTNNSILVSQVDFTKTLALYLRNKDISCNLCNFTFSGTTSEVSHSIINYFRDLEKDTWGKNRVYLLAGESTVRIPSSYKNSIGGRNQHLLLELFLQWRETNLDPVMIITFATDGVDGNSDFAGGWISTDISRFTPNDIQIHLENFTSTQFFEDIIKKTQNHNFFDQFGLIQTGPTGINFADCIVIIRKRSEN